MVAHELGHQKHDDLLRGLAWLAIVAPAGTFLVQAPGRALRAAREWALGYAGGAARDRARDRAGQPRPGLRLERAVARGGGERRHVRAAAHATTRSDFIGFQRRISIQNVGDPDPPAVVPRSCSERTRRRSSGSARRGGSSPSSLPPLVSRRAAHRAGDPRAGSYERGSASPGERRAAEWLAGELRDAGCRDVRVEEERAHGGYWWPLGLLNAGVGAGGRARPACPPRSWAAPPRRRSTTT